MPTDLPTLDQGTGPHESERGRFIVDLLFRHWKLITACVAIGAISGAAAGIVMHRVRHEYAAQTDLVVKPSHWQTPALSNLDTNVFGETTPTTLMNRLDTVALSRDVAKALVQDDLAAGRAGATLTSEIELNARAAAIERSMSIEPFDSRGVLRVVTYSATGPDAALRLAEYTARGLIDHTQLQRLDEQEQAYTAVLQQIDELRAQLDEAEGRQWDYRERMGFQTHEQVWLDIERKNGELQDARAMARELEDRIAEIDGQLAANSSRIPEVLGNVTESVVRDLLGQLDELRTRELELSVVWKPGYPELDRLQAEIDEKKEAVLLAIGELRGGVGGSSLWDERQDLYRQKVELKSQLMSYSVRAASLERTVQEFSESLPQLADQSFEYTQLARESDQLRVQLDKLLEKEFELRTAMRRGSATVERRSAPALLPDSHGRSAPLTATTLLGGIIGLVTSLAYTMLREINDTKIRSVAQVTHYIGLEVIGTIPEMRFSGTRRNRNGGRGAYIVNTEKAQVEPSIVTQHDPKSPVSEAYRSLRTNFQFATLQHGPKTIMVTSSVPAEGKTTTAANFAVTMADLGKRVVLVDTDLRRPNVHRVLRMPREKGLADVLRGQAGLDEVIRQTVTSNLWMISSGRVPPNPSELISSEGMAKVMEALKGRFDVVVCDAPSTLVVTDPVVLATRVDSVLLVIAANRAGRETIQRAVKVLESAATPIAGVVLNGIKATARHYYYYYYYYDEQARERRRSPQAVLPVAAGGDRV
jgi:capsular exopolysaccharide synthesis family protein